MIIADDIKATSLRVKIDMLGQTFKCIPDEAVRSSEGVQLTLNSFIELEVDGLIEGMVNVYASSSRSRKLYLGSSKFVFHHDPGSSDAGESIDSYSLNISPIGDGALLSAGGTPPACSSSSSSSTTGGKSKISRLGY